MLNSVGLCELQMPQTRSTAPQLARLSRVRCMRAAFCSVWLMWQSTTPQPWPIPQTGLQPGVMHNAHHSSVLDGLPFNMWLHTATSDLPAVECDMGSHVIVLCTGHCGGLIDVWLPSRMQHLHARPMSSILWLSAWSTMIKQSPFQHHHSQTRPGAIAGTCSWVCYYIEPFPSSHNGQGEC